MRTYDVIQQQYGANGFNTFIPLKDGGVAIWNGLTNNVLIFSVKGDEWTLLDTLYGDGEDEYDGDGHFLMSYYSRKFVEDMLSARGYR